jgi:hypothetical protein
MSDSTLLNGTHSPLDLLFEARMNIQISGKNGS